ncbi:TPA: stage II sporulation protein M, partial [Listeria innocua]|nr:stage II sporulation protein M [Listeria innocua]
MKLNKMTLFSYSKIGFIVSIGSFFIGIVIGVITGDPIHQIAPLKNSISFIDIVLNNLKVGFSILTIGAITGGAYSFLILGVNGYIIGKLIEYLNANGNTTQLLSGLLPHFFVELLGLVLFSTISTIPIFIIYYLIKFPIQSFPYKRIIKFIFIMFCIAMLFILIAGYIEATIS